MDTDANRTDEAPCHNDVPFAFGKNWGQFLKSLSEERIKEAEESLRRLLRRSDLKGCTFLDAGSGSGLFSLAAYRLGADVTSFDVDSDSVACTKELKRRYAGNVRLRGEFWMARYLTVPSSARSVNSMFCIAGALHIIQAICG